MCHDFIIKALSSNTVYACRSTIHIKPFVHQYFHNGIHLLVSCYECLAKFGKGISLNQDVLFTIF